MHCEKPKFVWMFLGGRINRRDRFWLKRHWNDIIWMCLYWLLLLQVFLWKRVVTSRCTCWASAIGRPVRTSRCHWTSSALIITSSRRRSRPIRPVPRGRCPSFHWSTIQSYGCRVAQDNLDLSTSASISPAVLFVQPQQHCFCTDTRLFRL